MGGGGLEVLERRKNPLRLKTYIRSSSLVLPRTTYVPKMLPLNDGEFVLATCLRMVPERTAGWTDGSTTIQPASHKGIPKIPEY
jgi:hypothetical protein